MRKEKQLFDRAIYVNPNLDPHIAISKAILKWKKQINESGIVEELYERQYYEKPSVTRRRELKNAIYKESLRNDY